MDIDMPEVNGLQGLEKLKSKFPDAKVLIFTVFEENDKVLNAICLGANGYILKSSSAQKIVESIHDVMNGGAPLTPAIAAKILLHFPKRESLKADDDISNLSDKEKEVLELLVKGYSYKMIADACKISFDTVRTHIRNIYSKLHVASSTAAVAKALKERLI
jgi:DNA-binding NarL/FixJ family response regulator